MTNPDNSLACGGNLLVHYAIDVGPEAGLSRDQVQQIAGILRLHADPAQLAAVREYIDWLLSRRL